MLQICFPTFKLCLIVQKKYLRMTPQYSSVLFKFSEKDIDMHVAHVSLDIKYL
jgi:hypothetical protein